MTVSTESRIDPLPLDTVRTMIMTAAIVGARALTDSERPVSERLETLMECHGKIQAARGPGCALDFATFRSMLRGDLGLLLPEGVPAGDLEGFRLITEDGFFEEDAFDLEQEQRMVLAAVGKLSQLGGRVTPERLQGELDQTTVFQFLRKQGRQEGYVGGRRALIETPAGSDTEIRKLPLPAAVTDYYREIPIGQRFEGWWYPCPECRWPMRITRHSTRAAAFGKAACLYRPHVEAGASYTFQIPPEGQAPELLPRPQGPQPTARETALRPPLAGIIPEPVPVSRHRALTRGVWRWTTVPGTLELALYDRLKERGIPAVLWPDLDTRDLDATDEFKADVKDFTFARTLAEKIKADAGDRGGAQWLVVPDHREAQLPLLGRACEPFGMQAVTATQFAEAVCAAAGVAWL